MVPSEKGFEYVIRKQKPQRVCFGSTRPRDTINDKSPFMLYYTPENFPNVAPTTYDTLESFKAIHIKPYHRTLSKRGYGGLARYGDQSDRREIEPAITDEEIAKPGDEKPKKDDYACKISRPRKSSVLQRRISFPLSTTPGPGMYSAVYQKQTVEFKHSFGGRVKLRLGTDYKCSSRNVDTCSSCGQRPVGDYCHFQNKIFLCRNCINKKLGTQWAHDKVKLEQFRKIRNCSYMHRHEGTNAKLWILHPSSILRWMRREAYVSLYIQQY